MKRISILILVLCVCLREIASAGSPPSPRPAHPCDIVKAVSQIIIPRISIKEPTTLEEALHFIYTRYVNIEVDPPRETIFVFEYRLPEATLQRQVSFEARDIRMADALKLALKDIPVVLTFESGKLIFGQPSPPKDASPSAAKP